MNSQSEIQQVSHTSSITGLLMNIYFRLSWTIARLILVAGHGNAVLLRCIHFFNYLKII